MTLNNGSLIIILKRKSICIISVWLAYYSDAILNSICHVAQACVHVAIERLMERYDLQMLPDFGEKKIDLSSK